jgi:hypothetical protein
VGGEYVSTWPAVFERRAQVLAPGSARFDLVLVGGAGCITYAVGAAFVVVLPSPSANT